MKRRVTSMATWAGHSYPGRLIAAFGSSQAGNYASGMAFNAFVSMFPLILGLLSVLGFATQSAHARAAALSAILGFFPADAQHELQTLFDSVRQHSGLLGGLGIAGLLWSGSSLFTGMEFALGVVAGVRQRGFIRQRAMALVMTILFVVSLVVTVGVNSLIVVPGVIWVFEPLAGLVVWCALMLAIYRLVPNRTYRARDLWPGVAIAGTAMEVLTLLWPVYTHFSKGSSTYGAVFALVFLLASWLYFLAELILLGAVANRMHGGEPDVRGLLGQRVARRVPVAEGSRTGGEVSRRGV
ncbi:MAG TPA: YihY/virulence factor BrkB family protein [Candidatus Saccharimonadales bacterium]|nr:YihY/virulence factor BrkB family protein [Candidatus Saccharimonadales bacterium]